MTRILSPLLLAVWAASWVAACGEEETLPDGGVLDAAALSDAGVLPDGGEAPDLGLADAGSLDVGLADTGLVDAGSSDSGAPDAGTLPDAGLSTDPITAPDNNWTWVDFPETRCMNDTPTGIGVNFASREKVVIFLMGGNACFNQFSCSITANRDGYGGAKFATEDVLHSPAFDRTLEANPLREHSFVFVPYCTGDVFGGTKPDGEVLGQSWSFTGYTNMSAFLRRLVPTFPNAKEIVLSGVSAGAFGATLNYDHVAMAFGPWARVVLLADSGPFMSSAYVEPCLQSHWIQTWGMEPAMPPDCVDCLADPNGSFMEAYFRFILGKYPDGIFEIISSSEDDVIRRFWGYGNLDCANLLPGPIPPSYSGTRFQEGLEDLRDRIVGTTTTAKLYMPFSTQHVWLDGDPTQIVHHGVVLADWMEAGLTGDPAFQHVPAP